MQANILFLTAVAVLLVSISIQQAHSLADCFSVSNFGCSGDVGPQVDSGPDCCTMGFLAYQVHGADTCTTCTSNVICYNGTGCSGGELGVGLSRDSCCTNAIGGLSYLNHVVCMTCPPRTPDPTTPPPTTMATTSTTMEISIPGNIVVIGDSDELGAPNIGAIVGGVIGGLIAVVTITTITVVAIVLVIRARPGP